MPELHKGMGHILKYMLEPNSPNQRGILTKNHPNPNVAMAAEFADDAERCRKYGNLHGWATYLQFASTFANIALQEENEH